LIATDAHDGQPATFSFFRVALAMAAGGVIGLVAGIAGAMLLSKSNLAPLFAILVTAPCCAIAAAFWEVRRSSMGAQAPPMQSVFHGAMSIWVVALLYASCTLTLFGIARPIVLSVVAFELLLTAAISSLLWHYAVLHPDHSLRRGMLIFFGAMTLAFLAVVAFPPVRSTGLWQSQVQSEAHGPVTFLFDSRLDGSQRAPSLTISRAWLLREWIALAIVALILWRMLVSRHLSTAGNADSQAHSRRP
jgi:hypothetical protein